MADDDLIVGAIRLAMYSSGTEPVRSVKLSDEELQRALERYASSMKVVETRVRKMKAVNDELERVRLEAYEQQKQCAPPVPWYLKPLKPVVRIKRCVVL